MFTANILGVNLYSTFFFSEIVCIFIPKPPSSEKQFLRLGVFLCFSGEFAHLGKCYLLYVYVKTTLKQLTSVGCFSMFLPCIYKSG